MITKHDIAKKLREILDDDDVINQKGAISVIQSLVRFLFENYDELDEESRQFLESFKDSIVLQGTKFVQDLPEGSYRRQMNRQLKVIAGKHHSSEALVTILERTAVNPSEVFTDTRRIFVQNLQNALDLLSDVVETSKKGSAEFAKIGLSYFCIDELLAAFHLAQHSFINQAYSHIRSVLEALDKIELFHKEPEWAKLWANENPKEERRRLKELSPVSVRKKLGRDTYDPFYSFFSEFGPHGTFRGIKTRSARKKEVVDGKPEIRFWIGGCPFEHNTISVNTYLLYALDMMLINIGVTYSQFLNKDEVSSILKRIVMESRKFTQKHLIPWAKQVDLDVTSLIKYLEDAENMGYF